METQRLFAVMGYHGNDGAFVRKVAGMACVGRIPWAAVNDAAHAVKVKRPKNQIAYFRRTLADNLGKAGVELPNELRPKRQRGPESIGGILAEMRVG